jgi:hypothetical protein
LRELQRTIIYTTKMSKQMTKRHVRDAVHMYLVNWGAMLTKGMQKNGGNGETPSVSTP